MNFTLYFLFICLVQIFLPKLILNPLVLYKSKLYLWQMLYSLHIISIGMLNCDNENYIFSSDEGEENNASMNGVEPILNGETVQPPAKNGAKSADSKMAASQSADSKIAANKTTPTKDEDKRWFL